MQNTDNDLNTLINEISSLDVLAPTAKPPLTSRTPKQKITAENVEDFVIKSSEELINAGLESIDEIRDIVVQGQNPDEIESLASLINSTTNAIEILNKSVLLKKKNEAAKELKQIDVENRKDMLVSTNNTTVNNTNVFVASRDEVFKKFLNDSSSTPPISIEDIEVDNVKKIEYKE